MIKEIRIKNFKSIVDLSFQLGGFNVLIGENGCGKSNILESIAFGAAACANKLDYEFLGSRGVRLTNPEFMFSAFNNEKGKKVIEMFFSDDSEMFEKYQYNLSLDPNNEKKWINETREVKDNSFRNEMAKMLFEENDKTRDEWLENMLQDDAAINFYKKFTSEIKGVVKKGGDEKDEVSFFKFVYDLFLNDKFSNKTLSNFIVYSPEQSSLRKFEETNQIYPLGIKGEGLFQYLKELSSKKKNQKMLDGIRGNLALLDWYENFELSEKLLSNEYFLNIKDKYINSSLQYFDQRSTNEGFLFLLFYYTLFLSKDTPEFFAIDNIDASLNPKLCRKLINSLTKLAKENEKQVIVTTQNPAILDGLNLKDESQRLFVIKRNDEGHTTAKRIEYKAERNMKLSDIWTNGFIGGLPENF
jgi:predicted ATPase